MPSTRGDVTIVVGSEVAAAAQKWDQLRRQGPEAFEKALRSLASQADRSGRRTQNIFQTATSQATRAALAFAGFGGALQGLSTLVGVIKDEIRNIEQLRTQRADAQIEFARQLQTFAFAVGTKEGLTPDQLATGALRVSEESGVQPTKIVEAMSHAASLRGDIDLAFAMRAVSEVARLAPLATQQELNAVAAGASKLSAVATSPEAAGAGLFQAFRALPTADPAVLGERTAASILSTQSVAPGTSPAAAFSAFAAIAQQSVDPQLRLSLTAMTRLSEQMQAALIQSGVITERVSFEEALALLKSGEGKAEEARRELVGFFDRVGDVRGRSLEDPTLSGEARIFASIIQFLETLDFTTPVLQKYQETLKEGITFQEAALEEQRVAREERRRSRAFQAAEAKQAGEATTEVLKIVGNASAVQARAEAKQLLLETGASSTLTKLGDLTLALSGDTEVEQIRGLQDTLVRRQAVIAGLPRVSFGGRAATPEELRERVAARVEDLEPIQQKQIELLQGMFDRFGTMIEVLSEPNPLLTLEGPDGERVPARSGAQQVVNP